MWMRRCESSWARPAGESIAHTSQPRCVLCCREMFAPRRKSEFEWCTLRARVCAQRDIASTKFCDGEGVLCIAMSERKRRLFVGGLVNRVCVYRLLTSYNEDGETCEYFEELRITTAGTRMPLSRPRVSRVYPSSDVDVGVRCLQDPCTHLPSIAWVAFSSLVAI